MRIGINLLPLWPGKIGGMETYVLNLLDNLAEIDTTNQYYLLTGSWNHDALKVKNSNFKKVLVEKDISYYTPRESKTFKKSLIRNGATRYLYRIWRRYKDNKLAPILKEISPDVWFCPLVSLDPRYLTIPSVITIPDIQHEYYPQFFSEQELFNREVNWKNSCYEATKILTISRFSKKCLVEKYGIPQSKVKVTLLAVGKEFFVDRHIRCSLNSSTIELPDNYIYYPANTWPHKNHRMLLKGFSIFKKNNKMPLKLVLSGVNNNHEELAYLIKKLDLTDEVVFLDYVDRKDVPFLYRKALFMIFPSLYEGFGMPLLEAMASECPITASDIDCIREIADDAVLYFNPKDCAKIANAINILVNDEKLRKKLIEAGQKRVKNFSWAKTAEKTIKVFEEIGKSRKTK